MSQKDTARLLLLQSAILKELSAADKRTRAAGIDGWDPGDNISGWHGQVCLGKVRVQGGEAKAVVTDRAALTQWARDYRPDMVKETIGQPTDAQIEQAAVVLTAHTPFDEADPYCMDLARAVLIAAGTTYSLHAKSEDALLANLLAGVMIEDRHGEEWDPGDIPGWDVKESVPTFVVTPDKTTAPAIAQQILSGVNLLPALEA